MTNRAITEAPAHDISALDQIQEFREVEVPCVFVTGKAGTGKSYQAVKQAAEDESWGAISASTGIASVNLGTSTINSLLRYFDTASLRDNYYLGRLARTIHENLMKYRYLVIDEASMVSGEQLTLIYRGIRDANKYADVTRPLGLMLIGDFAQLSPVREAWAFESEVWEKFAQNTTRLTHVWRQTDEKFLAAVDLVREGRGREAADALEALGIHWQTMRDGEFAGTTIVPVNEQVSKHNEVALDLVKGEKIVVQSRRWGQQRKEWGENTRTHEWGIPQEDYFKVGAYVMILANSGKKQMDGDAFAYANGDCGYVENYNSEQGYFQIKLARNGKSVRVAKVVRGVEQQAKPEKWEGENVPSDEDDGGYRPREHYRKKMERYVLGQIEYYPVRLAWASTCHKSQGLTLDRAQIDFRHHFFSNFNMLYVAISRVRSVSGLRLVGTREKFIQQCKSDPRVRPYL